MKYLKSNKLRPFFILLCVVNILLACFIYENFTINFIIDELEN